MSLQQWWRGGVIYQIYPRSLMDASGDGIGDLPGIITKLDYIASLGVDAIWISPFFKSPMKDFGYDIADYRDVDPLFGELEDFDRLIAKAHKLGLKVFIDQVLSHTSDQHAWFEASRQSKTNDKADWYVWADAKADGTPPNNWMSIFGGVAWEWEPRRQQYYLHNFLASQPDLNFHHPEVRQHVLDNVEFWLKRGVDGFRLDAINFCYHDAELRDNPAKPKEQRQGRGFSEDNPYAFQYHYYNNTRPENLAFMQDIRSLLDKYPGTVALGEISSEDSLQSMADYTQPGHLHMAYSFELLTNDYSAAYIRHTVEALEDKLNGGWPCWAIGNHDVQRVMTRWGKNNHSDAMARMLNAMLFSLKGSVCSYQGEELGLTEAELTLEQIQDPYGIAFWPNFKGRDGCRTPMPWQQQECNGGFSQGQPWLPVVQEHKDRAVDTQEQNSDSVLSGYREFLSWRKQHPALIYGDIQFVDAPEPVLLFERQYEGKRMLVGFNLGGEAVSVPVEANLTPLAAPLLNADFNDNTLFFPAYGVFFALFQD